MFEKVFGTHSSHEIKRIEPVLKKIDEYDYSSLTNVAMRAKTREFKNRVENGETLDSLLPEAFALVREAAWRVLGMRHYRVQLIGGIILHQGRIAEMRTGEGKTLVSTCPAYLNALEGKGVHIVTVNDYLAKRDAEQMGAVHRFLGLSVGVVLQGMSDDERREAYNCDITYVTNNELGFDYLRDNMVTSGRQRVQRGLHYCIIDEIDSVLIDEAGTPLIISGMSGKATGIYTTCDLLAKQMVRGEEEELSKIDLLSGFEAEETGDFVANEKEHSVHLTPDGVEKIEKFFHIDNLADPENIEIQHTMIQCLRANYLMIKDKDYVVKDDGIHIVDEFTGRILPGRRYSDGLHQAIEAKEHVTVNRENRTMATITFQNFFNKYDKKGGMTGTAATEEREFRDIYSMDVVVIPTNKPVQRVDRDDVILDTEEEKYEAVIKEVCRTHAKGQPVLVGTVAIETSELLSHMLAKKGIMHHVLNAKLHEQEAEIVAKAGQYGSVTIATNMAGRGTDIKLDDRSRKLGGLKIIGTERVESRRIDNQLIGRSGRQGDPGESIFYLSKEDKLLRLFGKSDITRKAVTEAQKRCEDVHYGIRKNLLKYDEVMSEQREIVYGERKRILEGAGIPADSMIERYVTRIAEANPDSLNEALEKALPGTEPTDGTLESAIANAKAAYRRKAEEFGDYVNEIERIFLLRIMDAKWTEHIDAMEIMRQGIGMEALAQRDPAVEYRMKGYEMFDEMVAEIDEETLKMLFRAKLPEEENTV